MLLTFSTTLAAANLPLLAWGPDPMIHFSCDLCKRPLDPEDDLRYVVKLEVYAAFDPLQIDDKNDDRDSLQDLHDLLEGSTTPRAIRSGMTSINNCGSISVLNAARNFSRTRWAARPRNSSTSARTEAALPQ